MLFPWAFGRLWVVVVFDAGPVLGSVVMVSDLFKISDVNFSGTLILRWLIGAIKVRMFSFCFVVIHRVYG